MPNRLESALLQSAHPSCCFYFILFSGGNAQLQLLLQTPLLSWAHQETGIPWSPAISGSMLFIWHTPGLAWARPLDAMHLPSNSTLCLEYGQLVYITHTPRSTLIITINKVDFEDSNYCTTLLVYSRHFDNRHNVGVVGRTWEMSTNY